MSRLFEFKEKLSSKEKPPQEKNPAEKEIAEYLKEYALICSPENSEIIDNFLAKRLQENKCLAIGEYHGSVEQQAYIAHLLPKLKEKGLTHLILELQSIHQSVIDKFFETGEEASLNEALRGFTPAYADILKNARKLDIKVMAVDPRLVAKYIPDALAFDKFKHLLKKDSPAKILVYYGAGHIAANFGKNEELYPSLGYLLKKNTQGKTCLIDGSCYESLIYHCSFQKAIEQAGLKEKKIFVEVKESPLADAYTSYVDPKKDNFKLCNNFDALLYHPDEKRGTV